MQSNSYQSTFKDADLWSAFRMCKGVKKSGLLDSFSENYSKYFDEEMQKNIKDIILEHARIIDKVCTLQHGLNILEPTKKIMDMKPKDMLLELGRYIAIKYINKLSNKQNSKIEKIVVTNTKNNVVLNQKYAIFKNITKDEKQTIIKSVERFNRFINFENDDIFTFQMLLFCLWWKSDNKEGIDQYYRGIEEVFEIFNSFNKQNLDIIPLTLVYSDSISTSASTNKSFEQLVLDITNIDFLLYSQQSSKHFCPEIEPSTYPDCGETVARNIINILCFNGNNFDTKILEKKGAIPELIEYYTVFNNFASQSTTETTDIFGLKLNARDAWSKLVINKSQENIRFGKNCQGKYGYDMRGGLTQDDTRSNLLQMLNNLFKCDESIEGNCINTWEDLATGGNITEINATNVKTGIGIITIKNKFKQEFKAKLESGHYSIELPKKKDKISYNHLSQPQKDILDVLTKTNITEKNYIEMNFSSEQLVDTIKLNTIPDYVKFGMFELSLTDKYDNDTRRRIIIYTEDDLFDSICDLFEIVATKFGIKEKELIEKNLNNYTFRLFQDFEFVRRLPALKVLNLSDNSRLINDTQNNSRFIDDTMDLSPLEQIEEIGDNFLREFIFVKKIDLSPLYNVHTIGNDFMFKCSSIKKVDLSSLTKLTKIGNNFMNNCESLETVLFNPEPIITFIGSEFMDYCEELKTIDLRFLHLCTF